MRNPLNKRIFKELRWEWKKFLLLFFILTLIIGFISGVFVAGNSMSITAKNGYEKYKIEDGHFVLEQEASTDLLSSIETECEIKIFPLFYKELEEIKVADTENSDSPITVRVFPTRENINLASLLKGSEPSLNNQIAIDRLHGKNQNILIGDFLKIGGETLEVCGLVSLSDYNVLFKSNTDTVYDTTTFNVATVTKECFDNLEAATVYQYSYIDNLDFNGVEEKYERANEVVSHIRYLCATNGRFKNQDEIDSFLKKASPKELMEYKKVVSENQNRLQDFLPEFLNQAIVYAQKDFGADMAFAEVFLFLLILLIAFLFAISTSAAITKERTVIGTIKAMGYSTKEILWHYIAPIIILVIFSALIGNILGYTIFKDVAAKMYYNSYSLPVYQTHYNLDAFVKTTVVPLLIVLIINFVLVIYKLRFRPIYFFKNQNSTFKNGVAFPLPNFKFFTRFKIRVVFQNLVGYFVLFLGLFFVMIFLTFSIGLPRTISYQKENAQNNLIAPYQYMLKGSKIDSTILKGEVFCEPFCLTSLETVEEATNSEVVFVYGYHPNSKYIKMEKPYALDECAISTSYSQKFKVNVGDRITLKERYTKKRYNFLVADITDVTSLITVFIPDSNFKNIFELEQEFSGLFSDKPLDDYLEDNILSVFTKDEIEKQFRQLDNSVGYVMKYFAFISLVISFLIILLLTKLIIEHNSKTISLVRVLGYNDSEVNRLYLHVTTTLVVIFALVLSYLSRVVVEKLWAVVMQRMSGWFLFHMELRDYIAVVGLVIFSYIVVLLINYNRVGKISMSDVIKSGE